jgi:hydroxypyruvate reductase
VAAEARLVDIASAALARCHGERLCRAAATDVDRRALSIHVAGAGKAAVQMARGVVAGLGADWRPSSTGLVVTKDGAHDGFAPDGVEVMLAGHPTPDARSARACSRLEAWLAQRTVDELVVFVLSGGASALLASPCEGLEMDDLQLTTEALVASGLPIEAINTVRRQLTRASAGRLAAACPARVEVLVLSDVVSGALAAIGSGPFAPADSAPEEALRLVGDLPAVPQRVLAWLRASPVSSRAPAPDDPLFARVRHRILAEPSSLLDAATEAAREREDVSNVSRLALTAADVGTVVEALVDAAESLVPGGVLVGGGEPVVTLPERPGLGGRNQHLALLVARAIAGRPYAFLSLGSDGSDGPTDAAGARVDGDSWERLREAGDPVAAIERADAYELLDTAGLLVRTGPTGTNLCDLHLMARGD